MTNRSTVGEAAKFEMANLRLAIVGLALVVGWAPGAWADEATDDAVPALEPALMSDQGPGWRALTEDDFVNVNTADDTWTFRGDGVIACTGQPVGVMRTKTKHQNFELVVSWRHLKEAGNSGVFVWVPEASLTDLKPGQLPHGIEVQILDHGYTTRYEAGGRKADWFTCHGDVFPVGVSKMTAFPPVSPNGQRSFPSEDRSRPSPQWNHYYVRAIDGEVRLWVNGAEVSGGTGIQPAEGFLCLESEGSPIEFANLRIRDLP